MAKIARIITLVAARWWYSGRMNCNRNMMGMMAAFAKLSDPTQEIKPDELAGDIQFALITTACGLAIAIPLVLCVASINVRIRKMEDLVSYGLNQFLEIFREANIRHPK